eukprot:GDKI01033298.1.p1 GENE.GDKI01033298.1~~GDKI01033298.1.p1  ORF type:complete len:148 (-),score=35.00 GDKI01033298.1:73-516(-)
MDIPLLFEDSFKVNKADNSRFERVSRLTCSSQAYAETSLLLDVNTDIYPVSEGQTIQVAISDKVTSKGAKDQQALESENPGETLMSQYDYVMFGKIFKLDEKENKMSVFASFGGLLMCLTGEIRDLDRLTLDARVYILIKKTGEILS